MKNIPLSLNSVAPRFGHELEKKQKAPTSQIWTPAIQAVFKRHLKYLQLGVVMGGAGACCSVSNGLIPLMGPKVPGYER